MKIERSSVLKAIAACGVFCGMYPLIMSLREGAQTYYDIKVTFWTGLLFQAAVFAVMALITSAAVSHPRFFSHPAGFLRAGKDPERAQKRFAASCCFLLAIPAAALTWRLFADYFECMAALFVCVMAVRCGMRPYDSVIDTAIIVFSVIATVGAAVSSWYMGGGLLNAFPVFMSGFAFPAMLISNQSGLERYILSKRRMAALIPETARRRGALAVTALFASILGITLLYRQITAVLLFIVRSVLRFVIFIARWIGSLLADNSGSVTPSQIDDGEMPPMNGSHPFWDAVLILMIAAVAALILTKLLPKLPGILKRLFNRLIESLKALTDVMTKPRTAIPEPANFTDHVEHLEPDAPPARGVLRRRFSRNREPTDPSLLMRFIYSRAAYALRGKAPDGSETTGELRRAASEITAPGESEPAESFARLSTLYELSRYRGDAPGRAHIDQARLCWYKVRKSARPRKLDADGKTKERKSMRVKNPF